MLRNAVRARLSMGKRPKRVLPKLAKWNVVKGDKVVLLSGNDQGKQGEVKAVQRQTHSIIVEGLNLHHRMVKDQDDEGNVRDRMIAVESPVHYSSVQLVDPSDGQGCKIRYDYTAEGEKVRVSKRTNTIIPKPIWERRDFKARAAYTDSPSDTAAATATTVTHTPSVLSFEEAILLEAEAAATGDK